ncbi:Hypothetical predicted protein [Cloeon dipterum]|uniref:Uncharacterized protein n=1 Tax=Cloeon dipterum TaxID=197152 RepID=A0A8S1CTP9_9INSE|nr:Hypothetical predicted protein [Cloeon dipterum]
MLLANPSISVLLFFLAYSMCSIIIECQFSYLVTKKTIDSLQEVIKITKAMKIPEEEKSETLHFFCKLSTRAPSISFNFYMNCDRKLITTMVVAIITNAVIIVQLNGGKQQHFNADDYHYLSAIIHQKIVSAFVNKD